VKYQLKIPKMVMLPNTTQAYNRIRKGIIIKLRKLTKLNVSAVTGKKKGESMTWSLH